MFLFITVSHKSFYLIGHLYINTQAYLLALLWLYICFRAVLKLVTTKSLLKLFSSAWIQPKEEFVMLHCFKKKKKKGKIVQMTTRFVNESGATTVRNWFERFRAGNFDSKREKRSTITDIDFIKAMLTENIA